MSTHPADAAPAFKPKKSVALSGVPAGNTAICTVGHAGDSLYYRGYEIGEVARQATYEEVAHLLIHERLPNARECAEYRNKLSRLRSLPARVRTALEQIPASAHPMDVLRTGCSILGTVEPEGVGILVDGLVAVGRGDPHLDPVADVQRHPADRGLPGAAAAGHLDRRVDAQRLLHVVGQE